MKGTRKTKTGTSLVQVRVQLRVGIVKEQMNCAVGYEQNRERRREVVKHTLRET